MAIAMAQADGTVEENEVKAVMVDLKGFGKSDEEAVEIIKEAGEMTPAEAVSLISNLGIEEKKYVCAFLAVVMAVDGDIADEELKMWRLISQLCGLPNTTVNDAVELWKSYNS
jgi:uncharacterized membrane protein YebE (DUF533 family)